MSRRAMLTTGIAAASAPSVYAASRILDRFGLIPPDHRGIYGVGETLTYAAQRLVTSHGSLAREFTRSQISTVVPVKGRPPKSEAYRRLSSTGFEDWRITVDGLVAHPTQFSVADLRRIPSRTQITHQACEEGWSFIAEWTGAPLSSVLGAVGVRPEARYVVFFAFDRFWESLDMADAWHPQTLLAYEMNGEPLPVPHGAPVRVRVARQLGFKSVKYVTRVMVTDTLKQIGRGLGSIAPEYGYPWYGGI
jgi:DMSO/TMAO reductase YedYZ molybdopterin-dependent catalytic subunit